MDPFAFAQREHDKPSRNWHNCCGIFTRSAFGAPSIGDFDGDGSADAEDIWKAAKHKHPETDPTKIPRGVPVFWSGGSTDNGHAAVSRGNGTIWTTDLVRDGKVDVAPTADVARKWGLTLLGWTEDINGVRVWTPLVEKPKPTPVPVKVPVTRLNCATWNLHQGGNVADRVQEVIRLLDDFDIDVLLVQEANDYAKALRRALRGHYRVGTFWARGGSARDSAVISRKGLRTGVRRLHRLEHKGWERGKGRKGLHWARSMVSRNVAGIRFAATHQAPGPFGPLFPLRKAANLTGFAKAARLGQRWTKAGRPWVMAGDWNRRRSDPVAEAFITTTGATVRGGGIDWVAAHDVTLSTVVEHRFGTSDHDPKTFTITKERK